MTGLAAFQGEAMEGPGAVPHLLTGSAVDFHAGSLAAPAVTAAPPRAGASAWR